MIPAPKHPDEKNRLASLAALDILDSLPEVDFDQITQLASEICGTPIALISLIDQDRQWFKSKIGLEAPQTERELSFCAHAILQPDVFVVEDSSKDNRFFDNPLATGRPQVQFYAGATLLSPDGQPIGTVCVIDKKARKLSLGQIASLKSLSNQVTQLLKLRIKIKKLEISQNLLSTRNIAIEAISEGVVIRNAKGQLMDINSSALRILGIDRETMMQTNLNQPTWKAINPDGSPLIPETHPAEIVLRTGQSAKTKVMGITQPSGALIWIQVNAEPIYKDNSKELFGVAASFADITELKKLESKLAQAARLSALGEMAGGAAHEINTPLAIIMGSTDLILKDLQANPPPTEKISQRVQKIHKTAERISKIVNGLKLFSRTSSMQPCAQVSVQSLIQNTLDLCQDKLTEKNVTMRLNIADSLQVFVRPTEISHALMNLISNSLHAISTLADKWIEISVSLNANKVVISVTDSGQGIPAAVAEKIMNPFFTTKDIGQGMGLGLSIAKGIIEAHSGKIYYDPSSANTRFIIEIPLAMEQSMVA